VPSDYGQPHVERLNFIRKAKRVVSNPSFQQGLIWVSSAARRAWHSRLDHGANRQPIAQTPCLSSIDRSTFAAMTRRARQRLRITIGVIFCLLFQQVALAAYACQMETMPPQTAAMGAHCAEMGMQQAQDNPILCAKHCAPDRSTAADHAKLSVPALMLPPLAFAPVLFTSVARDTTTDRVALTRSDPPPRLRYCSLLI
jgi:hypothetical protein